ncbi:MAG: bifunctional phosphoribosylaminoimidazolecarboxamide formyltransferase/IMP cyclohydrolase, partial [Chloroflexota bacterium]|nr:bifunctional phosphoribosylaminoimidazolecarboxamide formyltransferase/IMP cyclohydrolase [Chloroflexota bacterium]MDE2968668.1 bifunctional phosphoribosylaminoimidazolecarboxamide formyltransferase/IMP cyclohydrolase [Chloroflexota bacterium]
MKALISVYDKTGVVELARALQEAGYGLVSTGGTHRTLTEAGLAVEQVSDLTGAPEMLDGRVKTLHPVVHGGVLARRDLPGHMDELRARGIEPIDVVVGNLYPFEATVSREGVAEQDVLENIDIGGPTMLRAAAKNHPAVTVVVDPADFEWVAERIRAGGTTSEERRRLAATAFAHVSFYDSLVAAWMRGPDDPFPKELSVGVRRVSGELRYGENPHQRGALYADAPGRGGVVAAEQLHGKELSYNNILDADAAWRAANEFDEQAVAVIKHTNACGLAVHPDQAEAYRRAFEGDSVSAYGGILGFNRPVTGEAAEALRRVFFEVIVAPGYEDEALEVLQKKRDLRILRVPEPPAGGVGGEALEVRRVSGGLLLQTADAIAEDPTAWQVVTQRAPSEAELADLAFAWRAAKHIKSNTIVLAKDRALVGMGAGQPNRLVSVHLAARAAGDRAAGTVLASDAFFPFADGLEMAAEAGVTAVVQPGGSIRDEEVVAAADKAGIAMVFTGVRHFLH